MGRRIYEDNFYDDGHEISMDAPRQNGWDYRSCPGSHTVGLGRAVSSTADEPKFRQTVARRAGRAGYATANRPPTIRRYFMLIKIL